jgi:hypothetical protein
MCLFKNLSLAFCFAKLVFVLVPFFLFFTPVPIVSSPMNSASGQEGNVKNGTKLCYEITTVQHVSKCVQMSSDILLVLTAGRHREVSPRQYAHASFFFELSLSVGTNGYGNLGHFSAITDVFH